MYNLKVVWTKLIETHVNKYVFLVAFWKGPEKDCSKFWSRNAEKLDCDYRHCYCLSLVVEDDHHSIMLVGGLMGLMGLVGSDMIDAVNANRGGPNMYIIRSEGNFGLSHFFAFSLSEPWPAALLCCCWHQQYLWWRVCTVMVCRRSVSTTSNTSILFTFPLLYTSGFLQPGFLSHWHCK